MTNDIKATPRSGTEFPCRKCRATLRTAPAAIDTNIASPGRLCHAATTPLATGAKHKPGTMSRMLLIIQPSLQFRPGSRTMDMASARNPIKCSETHRLISAVFSSIRLVSPDPSRFRRDSTRPGAQLIVIVVSSESGIATCDGLEATAAPTNVETATVAIMSAVSVTGGPPDYCIGGAAGGAGGAGRAGISWSISCTQSMQLNLNSPYFLQ